MDPKEIVNQEIALWCTLLVAFSSRFIRLFYLASGCMFFSCLPSFDHRFIIASFIIAEHILWATMTLRILSSRMLLPRTIRANCIQRVCFSFVGKCVYCRFSMYFISLLAFHSLTTILCVVCLIFSKQFLYHLSSLRRIVCNIKYLPFYKFAFKFQSICDKFSHLFCFENFLNRL